MESTSLSGDYRADWEQLPSSWNKISQPETRLSTRKLSLRSSNYKNRAVPECEIMITFPITSKNLEEKFGFFE